MPAAVSEESSALALASRKSSLPMPIQRYLSVLLVAVGFAKNSGYAVSAFCAPALITTCTHLGCTPNWLASENKFKCPCHGSGFYRSGVNFEGPAPRPLERARITLADDGQILVDKSVKYQQEKGEWEIPGSFLSV